jgi:hypothetical protein
MYLYSVFKRGPFYMVGQVIACNVRRTRPKRGNTGYCSTAFWAALHGRFAGLLARFHQFCAVLRIITEHVKSKELRMPLWLIAQ